MPSGHDHHYLNSLALAWLFLAGAGVHSAVAGTTSAPPDMAPVAAPDDSDTASCKSTEAAIAQLAARQFARRDAAEHYLIQQAATELPAIERALDESRDAEVIVRLARIAEHLFLKARTPFEGHASLLGISLGLVQVRTGTDADSRRRAILVNELQPGFPAAEVLRPGDRIIALNHEPFPPDMNIEEFRRTVNTAAPGTVLKLTVLRGRKQLDVGVRLAGVPEEGALAISEFVQQRRIAAALYLQQLWARHVTGLVIRSAAQPAVEPVYGPL